MKAIINDEYEIDVKYLDSTSTDYTLFVVPTGVCCTLDMLNAVKNSSISEMYKSIGRKDMWNIRVKTDLIHWVN